MAGIASAMEKLSNTQFGAVPASPPEGGGVLGSVSKQGMVSPEATASTSARNLQRFKVNSPATNITKGLSSSIGKGPRFRFR